MEKVSLEEAFLKGFINITLKIKKQDRKLSDARRDTWAHTSPGATTAPLLRMVLKEEEYRIRIRKSNSKNLSAKSCSQPKTPAPICVVVHSLHWMINQ